MLTEKEIAHLALLARLEFSEHELAKYRGDLQNILEYVGELQKVENRDVESLHHVLGVTNVLRADDERILRDEQLASKLLTMAPKEKNGFVVVPRVLYHEG